MDSEDEDDDDYLESNTPSNSPRAMDPEDNPEDPSYYPPRRRTEDSDAKDGHY